MNPNKIQKACELYLSGLSIRDVAKAIGYGYEPTRQVLKEAGVVRNKEKATRLSFAKGRLVWNKGLKTGIVPKTAFQKGHVPWNKGLTKTTDERVSRIGHRKGEPFSDEHRRNLAIARQRIPTRRPRNRVQSVCKNCGRSFERPASQMKVGDFCSTTCSTKFKWQEPDFINKMIAGRNIRPTSTEQRIIDVCSKYLPEFKYNGDFREGVALKRMIPDFINVNGKKEVIEVFGDYFHSQLAHNWKKTELGRIMAYNALGYRCLVLWESWINSKTDEEIANGIEHFFRGRKKCRINRGV